MADNVDEVNTKVDVLNIDAVQHAAEISYLITERTLGPDRPLWQTEENQCTTVTDGYQESFRKKDLQYNVINKKKDKLRPVSPPPVSNFPNINALNNRVVSQNIKQACKLSIRTQINELQQRKNTVNERIQKQQNELTAEYEKWRKEKLQADELIVQKAEAQAKEELEQQKQQLAQLHQRTKIQLQKITFQGVAKYQLKFRVKYEAIVKMLLSMDKEAQHACNEHNRQLRELVKMFEQLISKLNSDDYGPAELKTIHKLCNTLDTLECEIGKELMHFAEQLQKQQEQEMAKALEEAQKRANEIAASEAARKQLEQQMREQLAQKQNEEQAANATVTATIVVPQQCAPIANAEQAQLPQTSFAQTAPTVIAETTPTTLGCITQNEQHPPSTVVNPINAINAKFVDPERFHFYTQILELYQAKVERVKPLQNDEAWKKYRTNCQKAINIPLNAISSVNGQHLLDKFEKLHNLLGGQPQSTPEGGHITVNDHPLARDYCILLMAKKFVSQAETAISSNPQAAFPIASVIVTLWKLVPDFGQTLLAYIFKESPFMVPYLMPQQPGQSNMDYFKAIGYRTVNNTQMEEPNMYLKRQAGIARLYAAIMVSNGRSADANIPHPYGIAEAWRWLAHITNLTPLPDICATLIMEFLTIVGSDLWRFYGQQFPKLLVYIQQHYFPCLSAIDKGGPKTRLELLLGTILHEGKIQQAAGVLPPGFW